MRTRLRFFGALLIACCLARLLPIWTPVYAAIAYVDYKNGGAFGTSVTSTAMNVTSANALVVFVQTISANSATFNTPTDTASNTFHNAASCRVAGAGGGFAGTGEVYYAYNVTGNASDVVSVTWTGSFNTQINVFQYSGVKTSADPKDYCVIGLAATTTATSATFTPTDTNGIAIADALVLAATETWTAGTGFTLRGAGNTFTSATQGEDFIGTGTGSQTAVMTYSASSTGFIQVIGLLSSSVAATTCGSLSLLGVGCHE